MMPHERRVNTRKPLEQLAYLSLPPDNGGIVLDVSEGGLGFHAMAPVDVSGPIEFKFEFDSGRKITAVGELAWKDASGKSGGLRFTRLPDETRAQIRQWAGETAMREAAQAAARAIAKAISTVIEVSEAIPQNGVKAEASGNAAVPASPPPAAGAVTTAAKNGGTNGKSELSASPENAAAVSATANGSLRGKPAVAGVVRAQVSTAMLAPTSLGAANGKAAVSREVKAEAAAPVAPEKSVPGENPVVKEAVDLRPSEFAATSLPETAPIDWTEEWVREANILVSARAAGVSETPRSTPEPAPAITAPIAAPNQRAEAPPNANIDHAPHASQVSQAAGVSRKAPLLYSRTPPIYSAPFYNLSMFTADSSVETPIASPVYRPNAPLDAVEAAIVKHPFGAVGLTAALAFLVSIGIFSYLCTSPIGDAFANVGEKIWGSMYSHQMPADPAPPASLPDPSRALQQ